MYGRPCFSLRGMIWVFLQYSHIILNLTDCRIICYHMLSYYICIHLALPRSTTAGSRLAGLVRLESSQNGRTIQVSEILWFTQIFMVFCNKNHWATTTTTFKLTSHSLRPGSARVDGGTSRNRRRWNENGRNGKGSDRFHQFWFRVLLKWKI